MTSIQLGIW